MKIELIKNILGEEDYDVGYTLHKFIGCCNEMKNSEIIDNDINDEYVPTVALVTSDRYDSDIIEYIKYCPFCGKEIIIEIVEEKDLSKLFIKLKEEEKRLRKLILEEDSIKKKESLEKELKETRKGLDNLTTRYIQLR